MAGTWRKLLGSQDDADSQNRRERRRVAGSDIRRDAGLADAPYEEQHDRFCMAVARIVIGTRADAPRFARTRSATSEYVDRAAGLARAP
jgi:hypothetical protein